MKPAELKRIRDALGLTQRELGRAFGYPDSDDTRRIVGRWEAGGRNIPPHIARLAMMYNLHGIPADFFTRDNRP